MAEELMRTGQWGSLSSEEWILTETELIIRRGRLLKRDYTVPLSSIDAVYYNPSLGGRVMHYGDLSFTTFRRGGGSKLENARDGAEFRDAMLEAIARLRR